MIGISTLIYDLQGVVVIPDKNLTTSTPNVLKRRATSTKTLDGGVFLSDNGYAPTDNDINLSVIGLSKGNTDKLKHILTNHSRCYVSTLDGCFICVFKELRQVNGLALIFLVESRVDEYI